MSDVSPADTATGRLWLSQSIALRAATTRDFPRLSLYLLSMPSFHLLIIHSYHVKSFQNEAPFIRIFEAAHPLHINMYVLVLKNHLLLLQSGEMKIWSVESGGIVNVGKWVGGRWAKEGRLKMATSLAVLSRSLRMRERREQKSYKTT